MDKEEIIKKFNQIRNYYEKDINVWQLSHKIEMSFPAELRKKKSFKKILSDYIQIIIKFNQWEQQNNSQKKKS